MNPYAEVTFSERVLERSKVAARAHLSPQMAHDFHAEVHADAMTNRLVLDMRSYVMRERLLTDDQSADFSLDVEFHHEPRWIGVPLLALAAAVTFAGIALGSLPMVLVAMLLAAVTVCIVAANAPVREVRTVAGTVTIPVTSYAQYPDNSILTRPELGGPVRLMESGPASIEYRAVDR